MSNPYRESNNAALWPLVDLKWRQRVAVGAGWAEILLVTNIVLLISTGLLSVGFGILALTAWLVACVGALLAVCLVTVPRPGRGVGGRGWLLRASFTAYLVILSLLQLGLPLDLASYVSGAVLVLAAFAFAGRFATWRGQARRGWPRSWIELLSLLLLALLEPLIRLPDVGRWRDVALPVLTLAVFALALVRAAMLAVDQQWWFDTEMESPGEWVALLVHRDKQVEVLCVDQTLGWFTSEDDATEWLDDNGYIPAERALAERLVDSVPPNVLPVARRRKRLGVAQSEPRVRVEADVSDQAADKARPGAIDEPDETAAVDGLDTPEPPRTLTFEKPPER